MTLAGISYYTSEDMPAEILQVKDTIRDLIKKIPDHQDNNLDKARFFVTFVSDKVKENGSDSVAKVYKPSGLEKKLVDAHFVLKIYDIFWTTTEDQMIKKREIDRMLSQCVYEFDGKGYKPVVTPMNYVIQAQLIQRYGLYSDPLKRLIEKAICTSDGRKVVQTALGLDLSQSGPAAK